LRSLTDTEITALQNQGCVSQDWSGIQVSDDFSSDLIHQVRFQGKVTLGKTRGIFNSSIHNCEIGNDVYIGNVAKLQHYRIGDEVVIENVAAISVDGSTSFGNGFEIEALNEGGGRELMIFDRLSSQLAYVLACYRHDPELIGAINQMIEAYATEQTSDTGVIGSGTRILNSGSIYNVKIGEHATIRGVTLLEDGTISSNSHAPVFVGEGVTAKHFMILSGSKVDSGALIDKTFIGQAVQVGKQFSAENCLFFANSEAFHGEAVAVFGGPYTVSHHKSTLLIAGMYSFFNAGSSTNQSNHMYKLGPVHQGIVERGSKTGSFAYMLWPCRVGAYTAIMGKNLGNFDTSDFPFSYINVDHERSILTPGMNLFTVGTRRDSEKWPNRDKRTDPDKLDLINFELFSPYIIERVVRAIRTLNELYEKTPQKQDSVFYKGIRIKRLMLKSTRKYYDMALAIFIGGQVIAKLEEIGAIDSIQTLRQKLASGSDTIPDKWLDLAGMIAPDHAVQDLISEIKSGRIKDLDEIVSGLERIHTSYKDYAWDWTTRLLKELNGIDVQSIEAEQLVELVNNWETASIKLDKMILSDAGKEFDNTSKIGFGIDGDAETVDRDFEAVRGTIHNNKFTAGLQQEMAEIADKASRLRDRLSNI
jgi:carbonic anhydrase/acetyltransferase-like protein (isoleucine patch superfamily)